MTLAAEEISQARNRLLDRTVAFFNSEPGVIGIFLSGSVAAGTADAYSDIDLRLVANPAEHKRLVDRQLQMPAAWGGLLFNEWIEGAQHCVSHFRPFLKMDVFYINASEFHPSPWLKLPTKIFLDHTGLVKDVLERSKQVGFETANPREVDRMLSRALAAAHEVVRRLRRRELLYAQSLLEECRCYMTRLDGWIHPFEPKGSADLKLERRLSYPLKRAIEQSYVGLDPSSMEDALVRLAEVLKQQIMAVHQKFLLDQHQIENDLYAVELVLQREIP